MPSIIGTHHRTDDSHHQEEVGEYKESNPPLSCSLFIERSEHFPHCLLEIPLATPWLKQTLRLATRTYSLHNYLPITHRLQSIYYSYVCAITSTASHQPQPPTLTRTAAYPPIAPVKL